MGPEVAAVRLRNSAQERTTQRGDRRFVKAATTGNALSDQGDVGGGSFCRTQLDSGNARKDKDPAAKVSGLMEGNTLYRNIPQRVGSEDVATWKMCVPKRLQEMVAGSRRSWRRARAQHCGCTTRVAWSMARNLNPASAVMRFEVPLGKGNVIKAFDMGVATMKIGERCLMTCAPNYAYQAAGSPPAIPPDATLNFELEMMGWKGEDLSPNQDGSIDRTILEDSDKKRTPSDDAFVRAHISGAFEGSVFEESRCGV